MKRKPKQDMSNQVRIIGGTHRSRPIRFPALEGLRPTGDRIRETLFNWLQDQIAGSRCLDLFAGSGALGIEALSRGATFAQFVEYNREAAEAIKTNLDVLGIGQGEVSHSSAEDWLPSTQRMEPFDVVFLDPPFAEQKLTAICESLASSQCVQPGTLVYIENGEEVDAQQLPDSWSQIKQKKGGRVSFYLFEVE